MSTGEMVGKHWEPQKILFHMEISRNSIREDVITWGNPFIKKIDKLSKTKRTLLNGMMKFDKSGKFKGTLVKVVAKW